MTRRSYEDALELARLERWHLAYDRAIADGYDAGEAVREADWAAQTLGSASLSNAPGRVIPWTPPVDEEGIPIPWADEVNAQNRPHLEEAS